MIVNIEGHEINLPDFLIVGAAKSGTTSLYFYLKKCHQVFLPKVKEPSFFSFMDNAPNFTNAPCLNNITYQLKEYLKLFNDAKYNQIIGDTSPCYLYTYKSTIDNIKRIYGEKYKDLKIIIICRNPAERAWSNFMMLKRSGVEPLDFEEAIKPNVIRRRLENNWDFFYDYIGFGMYFNPIKAFCEEFPQVKIFFLDELKKDNVALVKKLFQFLNINENLVPKNINKQYNISGVPKNIFIYPIYKLIFHRNFLKSIFVSFLPEDISLKIGKFFQQILLTRKTIDIKLKKKLIFSFYVEDINNLKTLLKNKHNILENWLNI